METSRQPVQTPSRRARDSGFSILDPYMRPSLVRPGFFVLEDHRFSYRVPASLGFPVVVIRPQIPMVADLTSLLFPARAIWDRHGVYTPAVLVHVWLYTWAKILLGMGFQPPYTRRMADLVFLAAMKDCNTPRITRTIFYRMVRIRGGW